MGAKSSPRSGEMFIATRLSLLISAKSEIQHFALCRRSAGSRALSINIPCLRHVSVPFVRAITFEAKPYWLVFWATLNLSWAEPRIHCEPERKRRALPHIRRQSRQLYAACDSQKSNLIASCTCRGVANVVVPDAGEPNVRGVPNALNADGKLNVPA